jgi:ACS family glucarate transporter-like MFS transporter
MQKTVNTETKKSPRPDTKYRWIILAALFVITIINYADRAILSIAGPAIAEELQFTPIDIGYIFSAFAWSYVLCQLPGGWLLDRFGSKRVYFFSIFFWSLFTFVQGAVGFLAGGIAVSTLFTLRLLVGAAEAPSFPGNSRITQAWFPNRERGRAAAIFNSAQYFSTVIFAPFMGWIVFTFGWQAVFFVMGGIGLLMAFSWLKVVYNPSEHPKIGPNELAYIEAGGGLTNLDKPMQDKHRPEIDTWSIIKQLLKNRMLLGVYLGQYCITTLTYFFLTWFPVYLVNERGMTILSAGLIASLPAICGFIGGISGGWVSDKLMNRNFSLSTARKIPIVTGMLLSMSMVVCNYVEQDALVVAFMSLAFFGKGVGALGWAVVSDTAPKEAGGLSGGLFNTFGNTAGITTPIIIGYIVAYTGSFAGALVFVAANAAGAIFCYLFLVGEIKRVHLTDSGVRAVESKVS